MVILPIRNKLLTPVLMIVMVLAGACGLLVPPAPQPQLSATDIPPKATALSKLPDTWTPVPTNTPLPPTPTRTPTQDPANYRIDLVLDPEPISYPTQFSDRTNWEIIEGKTASIAIPPSYQVVDFAGTFMELMFGLVESFAEGFVEMAQDLGEEFGATPQATPDSLELEELPEFDFILAMEETTQSGIVLVSVDREPDTTTEDLVNEALSDSENPFEVTSRQVYTDSPLPMERVMVEVEDEEFGPGVQIIYVILGEDQAWNLVFTASAGSLEERLPDFESVVDSFSPLP